MREDTTWSTSAEVHHYLTLSKAPVMVSTRKTVALCDERPRWALLGKTETSFTAQAVSLPLNAGMMAIFPLHEIKEEMKCGKVVRTSISLHGKQKCPYLCTLLNREILGSGACVSDQSKSSILWIRK